ncbi:hypothetical protein ISS30_07210 [bacterium]|nr:hypothetical protein [bacterium]
MKIVSRANTWVRPYIPLYLWCHASPHDTNILFILCMVSTAESRHHNELNPIFRINPHAPLVAPPSMKIVSRATARVAPTFPDICGVMRPRMTLRYCLYYVWCRLRRVDTTLN